MLGLIKKDLLMIKGNSRVLILTIVVYSLISLINDNNAGFFAIPVLVFLILMTTFSYDEYNKTDAYISTFPCGRKEVVKAKYLITIFSFIASTIFAFLLSTIVGLISNSIDIKEYLASSLGILIGISLMTSIYYPLVYKFGVEKSRLGLFAIAFALVGIVAIVAKIDLKISLGNDFKNIIDSIWYIILPLISLIFFYISYRISVYLYNKKEF